MRLIATFGVAAVALIGFQGRQYKPKQEKVPGDPVAQPIAYSHKKHVALGLNCTGCHTMPGEGMQASYPKEAFCMGCHQNIRTDSPEIQKLAAAAKSGQSVAWKRVYQVPDIVWFSHAVHVKESNLDCKECHGDAGRRDVLFQEKSTGMTACMDCHAQRKAPNGCDVCHATQ